MAKVAISPLEKPLDCDAILATPRDITVDNWSWRETLAWLQTLDEKNWEESGKSGAGTLDFLGGSYSEFDKKRRALLSTNNYNYDATATRQLLIQKTNPQVFEQWGNCVQAQLSQGGIICYLEDIREKAGTLVVQWRTAPGLKELRDVQVICDGGQIERSFKQGASIDGTKRLLITRESSKDLRGIVNGVAGNSGDYSASFFFPAVDKTTTKLISESKGKYSDRVHVNVGPYDKPSTIAVRVDGRSEYESPGDPWFRVDLIAPGRSIVGPTYKFKAREESSQSHSMFYFLPAGAIAEFSGEMHNEHAVSLGMSIEARVTLTN
ncbi:alanyl-tRNA synthetase [Bradyrhizobium oligotrophicum S58]|uniref:Alanyl-tRNA synthetase n=1 Tax=Bradyrhizobium oligotrophicum S58 TaxID=1245469 RepID=M4ZJX1_9BRAD|nr:hypothetical protein [Bradyrhizobium oligotrophicum]BAM86560.1 alanyl-tRNA synthetase [Bradyrhizobium oligotrophicum S58]